MRDVDVSEIWSFLDSGGLLQEICLGFLDYCHAFDQVDEEERTFVRSQECEDSFQKLK